MFSLTFKRNYKLFLILFWIILLSIIFANTRIISYNFWKYETELSNSIINYTNSSNILDDSIFHEISIDITNSEYEYLINSYKNNKGLDKEYISVDITIDWKIIENVWLRLKWNIDLLSIIANDEDLSFIKPALLIKFDKYIEWQTYQWLTEIALRIDSSDSILWQLVSFKIFRELWLYAPEAWYTSLSFWNYWTYLYMVSEVIDEQYIEDSISNEEWVLYKALNSLSFSYLWDDPTLYTELFEQKSMENNYDMKLVINILEFVSTSSDDEFQNNLYNYIDIDSYVWMLVMDELLWREDMLLWLLNNYYIYVDTETNIASFISRDQKMSFWNTKTALYDILLKYYSKNDLENLEDITSLLSFTRHWVKTENINESWDKTYLNDLKTRFLENKYFNEIYQNKLNEYKNLIYDNWLAQDSLEYYKNVFLNYNNFNSLVSYSEYIASSNTISNFINKMKNFNIWEKLKDNFFWFLNTY